ncbi:hypothetical protein QTG54_011058 [Skeletonema marinoi]|uniref:Uncharacterized protein n=1 Tax=Skeletonema marinoi TaxID=267567 RepID=A0AAD9DA05_9STRA|nr:hypothetical protein QTG54_011058 [Skeletonema marinoi]
MDSDHVVDDEPLLSGEDDLQPSWVTLANEGEGNDVNDSLWDRVTARQRNNSASRRRARDDSGLPKLVLIMRLGNILSAGLLIAGSVGNLWKIFNLSKMVLSRLWNMFWGINMLLGIESIFPQSSDSK